MFQKLEKKNAEFQAIRDEYERKLEIEVQQQKQTELKLSSQMNELKILAADSMQLKETLNAERKKQEGELINNFMYVTIIKGTSNDFSGII